MNFNDVQSVDLSEFAYLSTVNSDYRVLIIPSPEFIDLISYSLLEQINILGELKLKGILKIRNGEEVVAILKTSVESVIILSDLEQLSESDWQYIDVNRNSLQNNRMTIFILTLASLERMLVNAPNLTSWIGGHIWRCDKVENFLTEKEIEQRLIYLRQWAKHSDEEVVKLAAEHKLPREPEYAEWLVLLGRSDLLDYSV
ncbi:MAG: hypothetical protein KBA66_21280 [Leptospiraceae bacterium]|nr:hypothetical protein [Leptospiraceae bacterium]